MTDGAKTTGFLDRRTSDAERPPSDGGDSQRPARARFRSRARRGAGARDRLGARRDQGRARLHDAAPTRTASSSSRSRAAGQRTLSGHVVHHQREDSARGVRDRPEPHRRRPDGRRLARAARRHDCHRHPPRALRAAPRDADVVGAGPHRSRACHRRALSGRTRAQHHAVEARRCRRSRRSRRRRRSLSKARGSTPSRPRRRASSATCKIAAEIQRALLPEPVFEIGNVDLAAESVPCRTIGGDFYDYLDIGERGFGFALGRRGREGPAGGAAGGRRAEQLCCAGAGQQRAGRDDGARQQGAAAARNRRALRDDVLWCWSRRMGV